MIQGETTTRSNQSMNESETHLKDWQRQLLPWMKAMIVLITIVFLLLTSFQLFQLNKYIKATPKLDLQSVYTAVDSAIVQISTGRPQISLEATKWRTWSLLEEHLVNNRYHHANASIMSRLWIRYLGFFTGMALAVIGAVFVLGKLRESESTLKAKGPAGSYEFKSASPGLVLATLGTILMATTIVTKGTISVSDNAIYTSQNFPPSVSSLVSAPSYDSVHVPPRDSLSSEPQVADPEAHRRAVQDILPPPQ